MRKVGVTLLFMALLLSSTGFISTHASASDYIYQNGLNYAGAYWHLDPLITTDDVLNRDFSLFKANNINLICLNIHWSYLEPSQGEYRTQYLDDVIRVCNIADTYGIRVVIDFHTLMNQNSYTIPSWVSPRSFNTVLQDPTVRDSWLDMLSFTVAYLDGVSNIDSWLMMNEPYIGDWAVQCSVDDFIVLWAEMKSSIRQSSQLPVSIKFAADSILGCFNDDPRIYDLVDYFSVNWFESYMSVGNFFNLISHIKSLGKDVAITEWGYNTNDDQKQYDKYVSYTSLFKELGVKWTLAWIWRSDSSKIRNPMTLGQGYVICANDQGDPRPAFYAIADANEYVPPDSEPPIISNVETTGITDNSATVHWTTNEPSDSLIYYDSAQPPESEAYDSSLLTYHSITLTGLAPQSTFYFSVQSTDANQNTALDDNQGSDYSFTTLPTTQPPQIEGSTGDIAGTTGESITITSTITDDIAVSDATIIYTPIGGTETRIPMTEGPDSLWSSTISIDEHHVGELLYHIEAQDAEGNLASDPQDGDYTITVTDNDDPIASAGPDKNAVVGEAVAFDASTSTDNVGIASVSWDFDSGDGVNTDSTDFAPTHVYYEAGTYTVTLTVTDEAGNSAVDTLTVTVDSYEPTADIQISATKDSNTRKSTTYYRATVTLTIKSEGSPLRGATVTGTWSGAFSKDVVGTTGRDGRIKFTSDWVNNTEQFVFTVTSVQINGVSYVLSGQTSVIR